MQRVPFSFVPHHMNEQSYNIDNSSPPVLVTHKADDCASNYSFAYHINLCAFNVFTCINIEIMKKLTLDKYTTK